MLSFKQFMVENPPAWHGTPHHFDAFSLDRVGTGEGHQAFGWGLYFASSKEVAEYYRDVVYDDSFLNDVNDRMSQLVKEMDKYRSDGQQYGKFNDPKGYELKSEYDRLMDERHLKSQTKALYHVEIIPTEDELMNWDSCMGDQSSYIKEALVKHKDPNWKQSFTSLMMALDNYYDIDDSGEDLYKATVAKQGSTKAASLYLLAMGIHGIKYLEGSIHGGGRGKYNYVIFDDKDVIIKEKF